MPEILLVARNWPRARILTYGLLPKGYQVRQVDPWLARVDVLGRQDFGLVILDVSDPEDEAFLEEMVERSRLPVLILTHRTGWLGRVKARVRHASPADLASILQALKSLENS